MKVIYCDESGTYNDQLTTAEAETNRRKSLYFVVSALVVDIENWEKVFDRFKNLRADLRHNYGIKKAEQIHSYEFMSGKGAWKHSRYSHLHTNTREKIFQYILRQYKDWSEVAVVSVVVSKLTKYPSINPETAHIKAYENLFNRLDRTFGDEPYIVIYDGHEDMSLVRLLRKMRAFNIVRTRTGRQVDARIKGLIEDPLFKSSKNSYFLQAIDHIAYSTLHIFDDRLHPASGKALIQSGVYEARGISAVHPASSGVFPGIIMVPSVPSNELQNIRRKSLGI